MGKKKQNKVSNSGFLILKFTLKLQTSHCSVLTWRYTQADKNRMEKIKEAEYYIGDQQVFHKKEQTQRKSFVYTEIEVIPSI